MNVLLRTILFTLQLHAPRFVLLLLKILKINCEEEDHGLQCSRHCDVPLSYRCLSPVLHIYIYKEPINFFLLFLFFFKEKGPPYIHICIYSRAHFADSALGTIKKEKSICT